VVAVNCGADILPGVRDVQKIDRAITRGWWSSFGYRSALVAIEMKLHEVKCYARYF
jgi:hypothetical protein